MLAIDFNLFNINNLSPKTDFEKKVLFFCEEWFSNSKTVEVQTSGSTGSPKKMEIEKEKMIFSAQATCQFLGLNKKSTALLALPVEYISGKMMVVRAMEYKMKLSIAPPSLNPLSQLDFPIDFCALTPLQVENSLDKIFLIQNLIIGGAAISENLKKKIQKAIPHNTKTKVFETYGMTETLSHIALKQIFPSNEDNFTLFDGISISVDERNCLRIDAPYLSSTPIQTNDVVEIIPPKQFKFLGRADFVINSGGAKIHPEEIERKLKSFLDFEMVCFGVTDEYLGEKLVLLIEYNPTVEDKRNLIQRINTFPFEKSFHKPKEIHFTKQLARTENGKINRLHIKKDFTIR